jgi:hypothetical protein
VPHKNNVGVVVTKQVLCYCKLLEEHKRENYFLQEFDINSRFILMGKVSLTESFCAWRPNKLIYTCRIVANKIHFLEPLPGKIIINKLIALVRNKL